LGEYQGPTRDGRPEKKEEKEDFKAKRIKNVEKYGNEENIIKNVLEAYNG